MAKVALKFGCTKKSKNLKRYLVLILTALLMHIFMQATAQTESLHTAVVTQSDTTVLRVLEKKE